MITLQIIDDVFADGKCIYASFGTFTILVGIFANGILKKYAVFRWDYKQEKHYLEGIYSAKNVDHYKVIIK